MRTLAQIVLDKCFCQERWLLIMKSVALSSFEVECTKVTRQPQTLVFQEFTDEADDIKYQP